jgi:hypothetical protein
MECAIFAWSGERSNRGVVCAQSREHASKSLYVNLTYDVDSLNVPSVYRFIQCALT